MEIKEFEKSLEGMSADELRKLEEDIIKEADENDKKVGETMFKLPKEGYSEVAAAIRMLLDKQSVKWQYTLGMLTIYNFFDPEVNQGEISYPMLDGAMRTLGALDFVGHKDWEAVVAINNYIEPLRSQYTKITETIYEIADRHSMVLKQLDSLAKTDETEAAK